MKKIGLLRLFACLPLIALAIPDGTELLMNPDYRVPALHIVTGAALVAVIGICTFIIKHLKKQTLKVQYQHHKN
ncbi:hypothetical protein SAMN05216464_110254 [Mucilaginibacter pineti]|uniref:Uncharacterized protein n=1 Tax=Mucilaginibacter pineti TaxID=1391627 RepID=A0A1G7GQP9_9SPHI|nr:hypothetical protein [Mucilaginibacter pineti]SDE90498.1 hypothetical protein SAMN05216464_110254 [Mucilaginibacter pineti]